MTTALLLTALVAAAADMAAEARFQGTGKADPIRIGNARLADGPASGHSSIVFDLAWDHSWREAWEVPEEAYSLFYPHPVFNRSQDQRWEGRPLKLENWDAAWVFVKFRAPGGDPSSPGGSAAASWRHATLSPGAADHKAPAGAALDVGLSDDSAAGGTGGVRGLGVFIHRDGIGSGPSDWKGVTLRWLSGADGVTEPGAVEIKVLGIQMVHVPQGAFWAGDGAVAEDPASQFAADKNAGHWAAASRTWDIAAQFAAGDTTYPLRIESEDALTLGGESMANLGNRNGTGLIRGEDFSRAATQQLPAKFPKGVAAFYCMRSEITEGQYVEFLNTLPFAQQRERTLVPPDAPIGSMGMCATNAENYPLCRNSVKIEVPGVSVPPARVISRDDGVLASMTRPAVPAVYRTDSPDAACGHMIWSDVVAYAGWAGLRPMTELEYEKASRGPLKPVPEEYAWGSSSVTGDEEHKARYEVRNTGKPDERVVLTGGEGAGNAAWWGTLGAPGDDEAAVTNLLNQGDEAADAPAEDEGDDEAPGQATARTGDAPLRGPLRAGVFAAPRANRASAGASYWGIMELSGNLWELVITVGSGPGRRFEGTHGDGTPAPAPAWRLDARDRAAPVRAFQVRGGSFGWGLDKDRRMLRTSDRGGFLGGVGSHRPGQTSVGFRCVRTAPQ